MLVGVLGPLIARADDGTVAEVSGPARRVLLAALAARGGRPVAVPTLIDDLWGAAPPATAVKTLQSHIVRLRRDVAAIAGEDEVIVTAGGSYRLAVERHPVDAALFERDLWRGTKTLASGEADEALRLLDAAIGWWRGEAYSDFGESEFSTAERIRLAELHALAHERRFDAALLIGRGASLVSEIEARIGVDPYRERLWEQLMVALYRADRPADALEVYRRARTRLVEELGIEPGQELHHLHQRILDQDESLRSGLGFADVTSAPAEVIGADTATICPYFGLARYEPTDSSLFVGREETVARLLARLATTNPLVITGDSGVGKSSLVRAGLLTALRADRLPGSARWTTEVIRPDQLVAVGRAGMDLLVVDQAEDMLSHPGHSATDIDDTISQLVAGGVRVVLVVRADAYGRLAQLPRLGQLLGPATELVLPLSEQELARVVAEPARRVGLDVAPELITQVLADVRGHSGALPLVSTALLRTWQKRRGNVLTIAAYEAAGGVQGALEATAEDTFLGLAVADQVAARRLLLRMVTRHGANWSRRALPVNEAEHIVSRATLETLTAGRLVATSADRLELVHDALLEHWPRLRSWLEERSANAHLIETLETAARVWDVGGRQPSDLIRGHRLDSALEWSLDTPEDVTEVERAFLDASDEASRSELVMARAQVQREVRARRRLRYLATLLAVAALVAAAGIVVALRSRGDEQRAARSADARRLAALSLTAPDLRTALLLAVAAQRLDPSDDTRGALFSALQRSGTALWHAQIPGRAQFAAVDTAGKSLWTMDQERIVYRYDLATRAVAAHFRAGADSIAAVSPDGSRIVLVGRRDYFDVAGTSRISVADAADGSHRTVLAVHAVGDGSVPDPAVFTGDGRWLAVAVSGSAHDPGTTPATSTYAIFAAADLARRPHLVRLDSSLRQLSASFGDIATVSARGTVQVFDPARDVVVAQGRRPELADTADGPAQYLFALCPDATRFAFTAPTDGAVVYLASATHSGATSLSLARLDGSADSLVFSPTGRSVATSAEDGSVEVFRTSDGAVTSRPVSPAPGQATHLAWAGTTSLEGDLYAAGQDQQVLALDTSTGPRLVTGTGPVMTTPETVAFTGARFVVGVEPATHNGAIQPLQIVDVNSGASRTVDLAVDPSSSLQDITVDAHADRALLVTQDQKSIMRSTVYDLAAGRVLGRFAETGTPSAHNTDVGAISPDGRLATYAIAAHRMTVVQLPSGRRLRSFDINFTGADAPRHWVSPLQYAPDGRVLVMGFDVANSGPSSGGPENQLAGVVDTRAGRLSGQIGGLGELGFPSAFSWSQDGKTLAIGSVAGVVRVVRARDLAPVTPAVNVATNVVTAVSFSPDGSTLVTAGGDGRLAFWDSHTMEPIGQPVFAPRRDAWYVQYNRDGDVTGYEPLAAAGESRWFTMPAKAGDWVEAACRYATGGLSRAEWARYVGSGREYQRLC